MFETEFSSAKYITFYLKEEDFTLYVQANCPTCGRFLKHGKVFLSFAGVQFSGWECKKCGVAEPLFVTE